jgi:hypothetical protein
MIQKIFNTQFIATRESCSNMPTTRSQTKAEESVKESEISPPVVTPEKIYHKLPEKVDRSLFQKRGGCIDAIPAELFVFIQSYLRELEYRNLMNTSQSLFQDIKFHTVKYTFQGPYKWKQMQGFHSDKEKKEYFSELVNSVVARKADQISVVLYQPRLKEVRQYSFLFPGIHNLSILCPYKQSLKGFPMHSAFSNISHVIISNVTLNYYFPAGLENVEILEFDRCEDLANINSLSQVTTLKKLVIDCCYDLHTLNLVTNVPEMFIRDSAVEDCSFVGNQNIIHLECSTGRSFTFGGSFQSLSNVQALTLKCDFHENRYPYDTLLPLQQIPFISLYNTTHNANYYSLPVFYGKQIKLHNFDLSSWDGAELPNVEILELIECKISVLPITPNLHSLKIVDCDSLANFPFLAKLKKCLISGVNCKLTDVSMFAHVNYLQLKLLPYVDDISMLGRIPHLIMIGINKVTSLQGLGKGNSDILLYGCTGITDFSPLKNVYKLHLNRLNQFTNAEQVSGVNHLTISHCNHFEDTSPLGQVKSLHFSECKALKTLTGLKNISRLIIHHCKHVEDFSGMGNHKYLGVSDSSKFSQLFNEYKEHGRHTEIFEGIKEIQLNKYWMMPFVNALLFDEPFVTFEDKLVY